MVLMKKKMNSEFGGKPDTRCLIHSLIKQLRSAAAKMLEATAMGHMRIVKPAIGMQAVSRKGPY